MTGKPANVPRAIRHLNCRFSSQAAPIDTAALYRALEDRFFSLSLRDETTPLRALWDGLEEDTLRGAFLRRLRAQYDRADEPERRILAQAVRLGLDVMDGREVTL